jgi:hypothetical protein
VGVLVVPLSGVIGGIVAFAAVVVGLLLLVPPWPSRTSVVAGSRRLRRLPGQCRRDWRWLVIVAVTGTVAVYPVANLLLELFGVTTGPRLIDFGAYYNAARRLVVGNAIYGFEPAPAPYAGFSADMGYLYPPVFLPVFVPLTLFPPVVAGVVWNALALSLLFAGVVSLVGSYEPTASPEWQLAACYCALGFAPTVTWLKLGQVSGAVAGLLCLAAAGLRRDNATVSGVVTTVGASVKPFYLPTGAHLLHDRRRFAGAVAGGVVLAGTSVVAFGIDTHRAYLGVIRDGKGWEATAVPPSEWFATVFTPFYTLGSFALAAKVCVLVFVVAVTLVSLRRGHPAEYSFALGAVTVPLAAPSTNVLALNALVPAVLVLLLTDLTDHGSVSVPVVAAVGVVQIHPYTVEFVAKFGPTVTDAVDRLVPLLPVVQPALWGTAVLFVAAVWRVLRGSPPGTALHLSVGGE